MEPKGPEDKSKLQRLLSIHHHHHTPPSSATMRNKKWSWWLAVSLNTVLLLVGQTAATLLNRYYYDQGGSSKWLETLTFSAAFPVLYIPLLFFHPSSSSSSSSSSSNTYSSNYKPSLLGLVLTYTAIGLITMADSLMYSNGLLYLPVSTYSLVCSTQLAFNAVFSYFINSEKFTHLTLNSVVVLTFSAAIVALRSGSESDTGGRTKALLGYILTLAASATYSLNLSLMELAFKRVIKSRNFSAVLDMQIYTAMVSTLAALVGLFASGEWRGLKGEMGGFKKGRVGWVMTVVWSAVAWQVTDVGLVGLIFEVSSLFSNAISTFAVPIVPVFAVVLFGDAMDGLKVISLLLALWGFISYFYQHYIDYKSEKDAVEERQGSIEGPDA